MSRIIGQTRALELLDTALRSGRFHHAWIFSGTRGVGKLTTAIEVARILLDPENDQSSAIRDQPLAIQNPKSKIQNLIDSGTHPDLHVIRKELAKFSDIRELRDRKQMNIPINLLRERVIGGRVEDIYFEAPAYRTPQLGHGKVFIIDEAELLDQTGQNAMLKTLEEPSPETYFFLVTNQPDRLLPTVRSRSQHVRFGRLDEASMKEWMKRSGIERPAPAELEWVLQFAEGAPGVALLAIEYGFFKWQATLEPMLADLERDKFPVKMGEALAGFVEEFAEAWVTKHGKKTTSKDAANKAGTRYVLTLLASHARSRLAQSVQRDDGARTDWLAVIDLLREAERQLDSNVNMKLLLENLVVQWAQARLAAAA